MLPQLCLSVSVVVWYVRRRKHSNARHSTAQNRTARQGTTPCEVTVGNTITTSRHRTAPRCAVDYN